MSASCGRGSRLFNRRCFYELKPSKEFVPAPFLDALAYQLELTIAGKNRRFMSSVAPRSGKTLLTSISFPAFVLGLDPTKQIIFTSYGDDLATEVTDGFQQIVTSAWYRVLFPNMRIRTNTKRELKTDQNGGRLAMGMSGAITGRGADLIIVDDIMKANDTPSAVRRASVHRFFDETLYSRLEDKERGSIVISQQRLHQDDLIGREIEKGGWNYMNFPAIAIEDELIKLRGGKTYQRNAGDLLNPERESRETLADARHRMGGPAFESQYQGQPSPAEGVIIKREQLRYWRQLPPRDESRVTISIDTAGNGNIKSDWSVCTVWHECQGRHYLVAVHRAHLEYSELSALVVKLNADHNPDTILIENRVLGMALVGDLRKTTNLPIIPFEPKGDKLGRLSLAQAYFWRGEICIPEADSEWRETWLAELLGYPNVSHDDQVDSTSQYLLHVRNRHSFVVDWGDRTNDEGPGFYDPMSQAAQLGSIRFR